MTKFLRLEDVEAATSLPRSTIYEMIKQGRFPASIPLSARRVGWDQAAVAKWQAERLAAAKHHHAA